MIPQFAAFIEAFKDGKALANAKTWKNTQLVTGLLTGLMGAIVVIAKGFGYDIQVSEETISTLAAGIAAAYGVYSAIATVVSSDKVGLPSKSEAVDGDTGGSSGTGRTPDQAG